MSIAARFYVSEVTRFAYNPDATKVSLQAVARGPENKAWATATPSGAVQLTIQNPVASRWFEERLGKDVAITFEDAAEITS